MKRTNVIFWKTLKQMTIDIGVSSIPEGCNMQAQHLIRFLFTFYFGFHSNLVRLSIILRLPFNISLMYYFWQYLVHLLQYISFTASYFCAFPTFWYFTLKCIVCYSRCVTFSVQLIPKFCHNCDVFFIHPILYTTIHAGICFLGSLKNLSSPDFCRHLQYQLGNRQERFNCCQRSVRHLVY